MTNTIISAISPNTLKLTHWASVNRPENATYRLSPPETTKNAAQLKLSLSQMAGSRLICEPMIFCIRLRLNIHRPPTRIVANSQYSTVGFHLMNRSEERRVGKECRSRGSQ